MANNERWYDIDGVSVPSVTTVLGGVVGKFGLIDWAVGQMYDHIGDWMEKPSTGNNGPAEMAAKFRAIKDELIAEREAVGYRPARIGNVVHDLVHQSIRNPGLEIGISVGLCKPHVDGELRDVFFAYELEPTEEVVKLVANCWLGWLQWRNDFSVGYEKQRERGPKNDWWVVESEIVVHTLSADAAHYAGTVDLVLESSDDMNRRYVIDIKTGSLQNDHLYQVAAYSYAYECMKLQEWCSESEDNTLRFLDEGLGGIVAGVDYPGVERGFLLQLNRNEPNSTGRRYTLKEARDWGNLYWSGFQRAFQWWEKHRSQTPGSMISVEDFNKKVW